MEVKKLLNVGDQKGRGTWRRNTEDVEDRAVAPLKEKKKKTYFRDLNAGPSSHYIPRQ